MPCSFSSLVVLCSKCLLFINLLLIKIANNGSVMLVLEYIRQIYASSCLASFSPLDSAKEENI